MNIIYSRFNSHISMFDNFEIQRDGTVSSAGNTGMHYDSGIKDVGYRMDFDYSPRPNHNIKFGSNYLFHTFRPEANGSRSTLSIEGFFSGDSAEFNNERIRAHELSFYAEDDIDLTPPLKANVGLNFSLFHVDRQTYTGLQPRLSARYLVNDDLSVKASWAIMHQYVHLLSSSAISLPTDLWVPVTKNIRPMRSNQFSGGVFYSFGHDCHLSLEGYYRTLDNVIEYRDGSSMFSTSANWQERVAMGRGTARGLELMAQKSGRLSGWIGYSLSWVDRQFPGGEINGGRRFWAKYDNRHKINIVANYKLSPRLDISGSWTCFSGNRMTIALESYEDAFVRPGDRVPSTGYELYESDGLSYFDSRNGYRMRDYHRLDLGFNFYRPKKKGRMAIWNLSFYNAYNRMNPMIVFEDGKDSSPGSGQKATLREYSIFPIIPSFSYTYKF